jgi:hypothetical protein
MHTWYARYAAITLSAAASLFLYQCVNWSSMDAAVWASWVQAVGSIVAISAGFIVAARQSKAAAALAYRERVERDVDRLTAAFTIARYARDVIVEVTTGFESRDNARGFLEYSHYVDFQGAIRALVSVQLHELRSSRMVSGILTIQRNIETLQAITNFYSSDPTFDRHDYYEIRARIDEVSQTSAAAYDGIITAVDQARAQLKKIGWTNPAAPN